MAFGIKKDGEIVGVMRSKLIVLLLLNLSLSKGLISQDYPFEVIDYDVFEQIKIGKTSTDFEMSLGSIYQNSGDWSSIQTGLDTQSADCARQASGNWCRIKSNGLELTYSDYPGDFTFASLVITNGSYYYKVGEIIIKVGDDINLLSELYPKGYETRDKIPSGGSDDYQILVSLYYTDTVLSFRYNRINNIITSIEIDQTII